MREFFVKLKGYQRWGQVLGVIAKLRWFEENNYLVGFCQNHRYDYKEISTFLKVSNSIIDGDMQLARDLKEEYNQIKEMSTWSQDETDILNSIITS